MDPDPIFRFANLVALGGWLLLLAAPHARITTRLVHSALLPLMLCGMYLVLVIVHFGNIRGSFASLDGVMGLFTDRNMVLAGWIHYLAFDMFIGSWEVRDARRLGIRHLVLVPCLLLTFMLGPIGLLLWFVIRSSLGREQPASPLE